jgi:hypothetical protein
LKSKDGVATVSNVYARYPLVEMAPLQGETILFHPEKNQFCVLNRTASFIWDQLATPTTGQVLASRICQSFSGVSLENALRDTDNALQQMLSLNFVANEPVSGEKS